MAEALNKLFDSKENSKLPIRSFVAAVSVGIVNGISVLDLCYQEDSKAKVDMNVIMTDQGEVVEVQGTGEEAPFSRQELMELLELAEKGNRELIEKQMAVLGGISQRIGQVSGKEVK